MTTEPAVNQSGENRKLLEEAFKGEVEAEVDNRRRISLGKVGRPEHTRYRVQSNEFGDILLTPVVSVPARELIVWEDPLVRASLARAIDQAEHDELVDLGSFAEYGARQALDDHDLFWFGSNRRSGSGSREGE